MKKGYFVVPAGPLEPRRQAAREDVYHDIRVHAREVYLSDTAREIGLPSLGRSGGKESLDATRAIGRGSRLHGGGFWCETRKGTTSHRVAKIHVEEIAARLMTGSRTVAPLKTPKTTALERGVEEVLRWMERQGRVMDTMYGE